MSGNKEKHYIIENTQLMEEWDWDTNTKLGFDPAKITMGSHIKPSWICNQGHNWMASIDNRTKAGSSCPFCSNKKVLIGYNDLASTNPQVANEWNCDKNSSLLPTMVMPGSNKKVWWMCSLGHEWQAAVVERAVRGTGCPYCANQKVWLGFNDLVSTNPNIASEWNYDKNLNLKPTMISHGSLKKVWWKCSLGHEWQETVVKRTVRGYGCPYCSGQAILQGFNDLLTVNPKIASEWHPTKNVALSPTMVSSGSGRKVWWKCRKGHDWQATIHSRVSMKSGCPICNQEMKTSFPEQAILFYCRKLTSAESRNIDYGKEIDIFLPEYRIGIEHNGRFYHKDKQELDEKKIAFFSQKGIRIISVVESDKNSVNNDMIEYRVSANKGSLNWAICELFKILGFEKLDIDVERDATHIFEQYIIAEKENSLASKYPVIANEWNYVKNGLLTPDLVSVSSGKKMWWKCQKGHEWQARVSDRKKGYGCPYCSGRFALQGFNDLGTTHPTLAAEWHPRNNGDLLPSMVSFGSSKVVWWKCPKEHEWQMKIANRTRGYSCPYCSGQTVLKGFNDLLTVNPKLATEWHPTKNGELSPTMFSRGSTRKVWWICSKGHEWQASIGSRSKGAGCPYCSGNRVMPGYNDLATKYPALVKEWDMQKNGELLPNTVTAGSGKKVWWKCENGHEWQSKIVARVYGSGCPICRYMNHG